MAIVTSVAITSVAIIVKILIPKIKKSTKLFGFLQNLLYNYKMIDTIKVVIADRESRVRSIKSVSPLG